MIVIVCLLVALAILFWNLNSRNQYSAVAISHGVLTLLVFFLISQDLTADIQTSWGINWMVLLALGGILVVNMVFSHFWNAKAAFWPPIFVFLTTGMLCFLPIDVINYQGFGIRINSTAILLLPFLGAIIEPIADMKEKAMADFFDIDFKNRRGFSRSIYFFFFGLLALIAHFMASYFGLALVTLGFASSLYYGKKSSALWNLLLALLAITTLGYFAHVAQIAESSLLLGRVLAGILLGGFVALYMNTLVRARKHQLLGTAVNWILILIVPSIIILAVTQNINFGGGDAFIGLLVGFSLSAAFGVNTRKNDSVLSLYLALGILLLPLTINKEAEKMARITVGDSTKENQLKVEDPFEMHGLKIELTGDYKIDPTKSQLTFELGPKGGRTKGAFKSFEGGFNFGATNTINVSLPVAELTTFNGYRDESLMDASYFNQAKFPAMKFTANSFVQKGDFYEVVGDFTMLETTKSLVLEMKYLGKANNSENEIFIGRSSLNRVDFGMKSDPKEGDLVDFQFKVELTK
ncbi:MAG: YceI family protein [Crocinitomicaceae bacterium]